jgi:hypothetical protein
MSVEPKQVEITSPCPITLDRSGASPGDRELFCGHCSKEVHLLSHMREAEARELLARRAGEDICVSYAIRPDGRIRFRPEPTVIPASALIRRPSAPSPLQRGLSMAASIGAAAWLSACTPHASETDTHATTEAKTEAKTEATTEPPPEIHDVVAGGLTAEAIGDEPCDPQLDAVVEGGLKAVQVPEPGVPQPGVVVDGDHDVVVDGGLEAAENDDPPAPPPEPLAHDRKPIPHKAGGLRAQPIPGDDDDPLLGL